MPNWKEYQPEMFEPKKKGRKRVHPRKKKLTPTERAEQIRKGQEQKVKLQDNRLRSEAFLRWAKVNNEYEF